MLSGKQTPMRAPSASHEHYLRAIWEVRAQRGYARLTDVARELGIAAPTLSVGVRALEARGLVTHDDHRFLAVVATKSLDELRDLLLGFDVNRVRCHGVYRSPRSLVRLL